MTQNTEFTSFSRSDSTSGEEQSSHLAKARDELHVGLDIPKQAATEVYNWVQEQDWPKGTELEPLEDYHITMLFAQGDGAGAHKDAKWIKHDSHAVTLKGIKKFPPSDERDGLHPIVLLVKSDTIHGHHNALAEGALEAGVDPGPYARGKYVPHMTVAYAPSLPEDLKLPELTFETAESSVSTPREEKESSVLVVGEQVLPIVGQPPEVAPEAAEDESEQEPRSGAFHPFRIARERPPYMAELVKFAESWRDEEPDVDWWEDPAEFGPLYHLAPTEERARIQAHGLKAARPGVNPRYEGIKGDGSWGSPRFDTQPLGVYVTSEVHGTRIGFDRNHPYDVWEVNPAHVRKLHVDPHSPNYWGIIPHDISPEGVSLKAPSDPGLWELQDAPKWNRADEETYVKGLNIPEEYGIGQPTAKTADSWNPKDRYWHITHDPHFQIDPSRTPSDLSSMSMEADHEPALMFTDDPHGWASVFHSHPDELGVEYENTNPRLYAAEIEPYGQMGATNSEEGDYWPVNRGFGSEYYMPNPSPHVVRRVVPLTQALTEAEPSWNPKGANAKQADSWAPKTQWPNALRERNGEPVDADCTCKDGEKLQCPIHGLHPVHPEDRTLEFPNPASPVGYDYHADGPRTWMRAETSYTETDDDRRDHSQGNSGRPDSRELQEGAGLSTPPSQTQRDSWRAQRRWLFDDSLGDTRNTSQVPHGAHQSGRMDRDARDSTTGDGRGSQEQRQDRQPDLQSQAQDEQTERRTGRAGRPSREAFEFGSREDADRIPPGQTAGTDRQDMADRSFDGFAGSQRHFAKKRRLWLDDTRRPPDPDWDWARNVAEAQHMLQEENREYDLMSLDHDLGMVKFEGKAVINPDALSGGDFCLWLHEHGDKKHMPKDVTLHTHNLHAVEIMYRALEPHTKVKIEQAPDHLEEDWAREYKIHEPSEIKKEEIHLPEKTAQHQLAWLPGSNLPGKGLVTPSGDVHTWPVDKNGMPHHAEYVDSHVPYQLGEGTAHFFKIRPRGGLDTQGYNIPANVISHILRTNPGLHEGESTDWHFGADKSRH